MRNFDQTFSDALEMSFRELALTHDRLLSETAAMIPAVNTPPGSPAELEYRNHSSAVDVLAAIMKHRFPEAAKAWLA